MFTRTLTSLSSPIPETGRVELTPVGLLSGMAAAGETEKGCTAPGLPTGTVTGTVNSPWVVVSSKVSCTGAPQTAAGESEPSNGVELAWLSPMGISG